MIVFYFILPFVEDAGSAFAQKRQAYNWVFGDSTGLNFSSGSPVPYTTGKCTFGENTGCISDTSGNLLFYLGKLSTGDGVSAVNYESIYNRNYQVIQNGDSLLTSFDMNACSLFLPKPGSSDLYYLLYINYYTLQFPTQSPGLYYSVLGASLNGGNGACIDRNHSLIDSTNFSEHIAAVRHANGRDWWILTYEYLVDSAVTYLLDTAGLHGPYYQHIQIGMQTSSTEFGQMVFSKDGTRMGLSEGGIINTFDFDRCTGLLTNPHYYSEDALHIPNSLNLYGCAFSPSGNLFYLGGFDYSHHVDSVYQLNLNNNHLTRLFGDTCNFYILGEYALAPDSKIYIASSTDQLGWGVSVFDSLNTHLCIIDKPDSNGIACHFIPYGLYLGHRRSWPGLPNMPNYGLYQLPGSPCDTLGLGVNSLEANSSLTWGIYPNPSDGEFSVFITNPRMQDQYRIRLYDVTGRIMLNQTICAKEQECRMETGNLRAGLYILKLERNGVLAGSKKLIVSESK